MLENVKKGGVLATTINALVKEYSLKNCLVKMDIEGAEYAIFEKGNCNWLSECKTFVCETHDRFSSDNDEKVIFRHLELTHTFAEILGENKIFIRNEDWNLMIENKIQKIKNVVFGNEKVFLYGKGKVGQLFLKWLKLQSLDQYVQGFVVSKLDNENICMELPVIDIEQLKKQYSKSMVVVCVTNLYRKELINNLQKRNLNKFLVLSDEIIEYCTKDVNSLTL